MIDQSIASTKYFLVTNLIKIYINVTKKMKISIKRTRIIAQKTYFVATCRKRFFGDKILTLKSVTSNK